MNNRSHDGIGCFLYLGPYSVRCGEDELKHVRRFTVWVIIRVDEYAFEERLVDSTSHRIGCTGIELVALRREFDEPVQSSFELGVVRSVSGKLLLDARELSTHRLLFAAVELHGDEAVQVAVEELLLPGREPVAFSAELVSSLARCRCLHLEVMLEGRLDVAALMLRELESFVEPDYLILHSLHREGTLLAIVSSLVPPCAEKVLVGRARAIGGLVDDEATAASSAEDCALQVEGMLARLHAHDSEREGVLHSLPQGITHERFMSSRILGPLERHDALVVGVHQNLVEQTCGDRSSGTRRGWQGSEAAIGELRSKISHRYFPAGVAFEGDAHHLCAEGVQNYRPHLATIVVD